MKNFISLLAVILLTLGMSSCNTLQGLGEDLQSLGEGIQDIAE